MLRYVTIVLVAFFLTGCYRVVKVSYEKPSNDDKVIIGYGYGKVQEATAGAWQDAREKLKLSGFEDYYGLAETETTYKASNAVILFTLVPLKDIESAEHDSVSEALHEELSTAE